MDDFWDEDEEFLQRSDGKYRKLVSCIVYWGNAEQFLLLHRKLRWHGYEFPKGGIKKGESLEEAARRELREEAGIEDIISIKDTGIEIKYKWPPEIVKHPGNKNKYDGAIQHFMLVKVPYKTAEVKSDEHDGLLWARADVVDEYLAFENLRQAFRKALKMIAEVKDNRPQ